MRTLKFYGASDDLFEIEGTTREEPDEIGCYGHGATVRVSTPEKEGLFVTAEYALCGEATWMIGISILDEDVSLPNWPMRWSAAGYSTVLEIDVPDEARVTRLDTDA